ncbi:MAG: DUF3896 domain-containing protein [Bacillaceae bacterium]
MSQENYNEMKQSLLQQKNHILEMIKEQEHDSALVSKLHNQLENINYIIDLTEMNHYNRG